MKQRKQNLEELTNLQLAHKIKDINILVNTTKKENLQKKYRKQLEYALQLRDKRVEEH